MRAQIGRWMLSALALATFAAGAAEVQTGMVVQAPNGAMDLYFAQPLALEQPVWVQTAGAGQALHCCRRLDPRTLQRNSEPSSQLMLPGDGTVYAYRLPATGATADAEPFVGIAMSAKAMEASARRATGLRGAPLRAARQNGFADQAYLCNGTEGSNLLARTRTGWRNLYWYGGYDYGPGNACTKADVRRIVSPKAP